MQTTCGHVGCTKAVVVQLTGLTSRERENAMGFTVTLQLYRRAVRGAHLRSSPRDCRKSTSKRSTIGTHLELEEGKGQIDTVSMHGDDTGLRLSHGGPPVAAQLQALRVLVVVHAPPVGSQQYLRGNVRQAEASLPPFAIFQQ